MMQEFTSASILENKRRKQAARARARAAIRALIAERRMRVRKSADSGDPPYLDIADGLPAIGEATGLGQGEVNQLAGSEIAAELRPEFEVDNPRVPLPPNPGGARTAASFKRVKHDEATDSESGPGDPEAEAGLDEPEPET